MALLASPAAAQMPDLSQMNGRSLPAPDAPAGSATVRVMRETLGNNVVGQEVTLTDANGARIGTRKTDDGGPRDVRRPAPGHAVHRRRRRLGRAARVAAVHAAAVRRRARRAGRRAGRGRRAAGARHRPRPAATPAPAGSITLGTQSRMIVEQADEFVEVFVLADLVNTTDGPVSLPSPIVFTPPAGALGTAVLEGSTGAALDNGRIVVKGPLPSGPTSMQFGYRLPSDSGRVDDRAGLSGRRSDEQRDRPQARRHRPSPSAASASAATRSSKAATTSSCRRPPSSRRRRSR